MERHLGRKLGEDEVVHHANQDRTDNRLSNLMVMSLSEHARIHIWLRNLPDDVAKAATIVDQALELERMRAIKASALRKSDCLTFREWVEYAAEKYDLGLSRAETAPAILGVSVQTVWMWLNGTHAPSKTRRRLLSARTNWLVPPEGFGPKEVSR